MSKTTSRHSAIHSLAFHFGLFFFFVAAAPLLSQTQPDLLDLSRFSPDAEKMLATCQSNWEYLQPNLEKIDTALQAKAADDIDVRSIGKNMSKANDLLRLAEALEQLGEPAGVDFQHRSLQAIRTLESAATAARNTPAGSKIASQASAYSQKNAAKRTKAIQSISRLVDQSKFEDAETEFRDVLLEIDTFFVWLRGNDAQQIVNQKKPVSQPIQSAMTKLRLDSTVKTINDLIKNNPPATMALIDSATTAVAELQSTGTTSIDGKSANGPQTFAYFAQQWRLTQQKIINNQARASATNGSRLTISFPELLGSKTTANSWDSALTELNTGMRSLLPKIIVAQSQHIATAELPKTYQQFVSILATLDSRFEDPTLMKECDLALVAMAKKDPQFAKQVENYKLATEDLLLWRSRLARSKATSLASRFVTTESLIGEQECIPQLKSGLNQVLPTIREKLIGKKVIANHVVGIDEKSSYSAMDERVWCRIPGDLRQTSEIASLAGDLFISGDQSPLSLTAAIALATANSNQYESVGGEATTIKAEGWSTRIGQLSLPMLSLVTHQPPTSDATTLDHMILQTQLEPEWVQHKYFFAKLK